MKLLPRPPRRYRRRLLLPPGWLALGWLLLLGCGLLRAHWRQLRRENVIRITMFPLKQDTTGLADYQRFSHSTDSPYTTPYQSPAELSRLRPWHSAELRGCPLADFVATSAIEVEVRAIQADSAHAGGVRVRLLPGATYANLVAVLDIMNFTNQKKYWLDIRHQPATWYAITEKELPRDPNGNTFLGMGDDVLPMRPKPPTLAQRLRYLRDPERRLALLLAASSFALLLAALGSLTIYRLAGLARSRP